MACSNTGGACYDFAGDPPSLGCYIDCVLPQIFDIISIIGVAVAIALTLWLIFQTIKNAEDQEFLQTVGKRWILLILFVIIVATRGGIIFIPLKFLGFEGVSAYDSYYQGLIDLLDVTRKESGTSQGNNDNGSSQGNNDNGTSQGNNGNGTSQGNGQNAPQVDTDGDGQPDSEETGDTDGDGKPDSVESDNADADGDGISDERDPNDSDPCLPTANNSACKKDTDNDGTPDNQDSNINDPCIPDNTVGVCDKDGDGLLNSEESSTTDTDLDGIVDRDDQANKDPCIPSESNPACNILKEPDAAAICKSLNYCQDGSNCTALECLNCWEKGFIAKPNSCN